MSRRALSLLGRLNHTQIAACQGSGVTGLFAQLIDTSAVLSANQRPYVWNGHHNIQQSRHWPGDPLQAKQQFQLLQSKSSAPAVLHQTAVGAAFRPPPCKLNVFRSVLDGPVHCTVQQTRSYTAKNQNAQDEDMRDGSRSRAAVQGHTDDTNQENSKSSSPNGSGGDGNEGNGLPDFLVEWRLESSQWFGGNFERLIQMFLQRPQAASWGYLFPGKQSLHWWGKLYFIGGCSIFTRLVKGVYNHTRDIAEETLQIVHEELTPEDSFEEFKNNLGVAMNTVLRLYSEADWEALKPMVSAALLESMKEIHEYEIMAAGEMRVDNVSLEIHKLNMECVHAITREQLSAFDSERSQMQLKARGTTDSNNVNAMWDVLHVYVDATWHADLKTADGSEKVNFAKSGFWVFCRGPVQFDQKIPADADLPWFVMTWM